MDDKINALHTYRKIKNTGLALALTGFTVALGYSSGAVYEVAQEHWKHAGGDAAMASIGAMAGTLGARIYRKLGKPENEEK